MVWTTPRTWVTGEVPTAAIMNLHVRDNMTYLDTLPLVPPGVIAAHGSVTPPSGWLVCDGTAVNRTTYAALFAIVGGTWGAGDGSTTFNLPDLRGRVLIGAGTGSGLSARTHATAGGAETATVSIAEMGVHAHSIGNPVHYHAGDTFSSFWVVGGAAYLSNTTGFSLVTSQARATGVTLGAQGSGTAHANMQPWIALNHVIKT